jgi:hypothetical protein
MRNGLRSRAGHEYRSPRLRRAECDPSPGGKRDAVDDGDASPLQEADTDGGA